ncbi:MAG: SGNH/GDSL hydrolase family protein [Clostridia bacterium]|nr:SGNH/GDSL hydrolase family protein [Clostridia bacterium]
MKKIVLIGDSIRMGYDKYVKAALEGVAEVYYPPENGRFAANVLRFAHSWKKDGEWPDDVDLVHWNAGLWDCIHLFGDEAISTPEYYANVIPRIDKRLRMLFPKAKMVFATSTSVIENFKGDAFRRNEEIAQYNAIALQALAGTDTLVNDLYSLSLGLDPAVHSDNVHYNTDEGRRILGGRVLAVVCKELGIDGAEVRLENFKPEDYSEKEIGY